MKRWHHVVVAVVVPFAGVFYATQWILKKLAAWQDDSRRTIDDPDWHRDFRKSVAYAESQEQLPEPMPWARPPRITDGPVSDYRRTVAR